MTPTGLALVIGAVATLITAITGAAVSIAALRVARRTNVLVNGHHADERKYRGRLVDALRSAGLEVPDDQTLDDPAVSDPPDTAPE